MPPTSVDPCRPIPRFPTKPRFEAEVRELTKNLKVEVIKSDLNTLTAFHTRYFRTSSGRDASLWVRDRLRSVVGDNVAVELFNHTWSQPSVIARVQGSSNKTIILSAHLDSINLYAPLLLAAPGANDDASGVSALISVFSTITSSPLRSLKNTLEFHFYAAEEAGFWGSADVFSVYNREYRDIHSVLQFDMIGRVLPSKPAQIGVVANYMHQNFIEYIRLLVNTYAGIPAVDTLCGYACSDHTSAMRFGYPGGLITSGKLEDVVNEDKEHTGGDTAETLDLEQVMRFVRFGVGWAYELGYADLGEGVRRGGMCDLGYPDGWTGSVRRMAAARAADPLGISLWLVVAVIMLAVARPWEEFPWVVRMGRRVRRVVKGGGRRWYAAVKDRDASD